MTSISSLLSSPICLLMQKGKMGRTSYPSFTNNLQKGMRVDG